MTPRLVTPALAEFPSFLRNIESKWRVKVMRRFERERFVASRESNESKPRYILSMFPYPSGRLHLGHVRTYTSSDILTRYSRLMRKNDCLLTDFENVINPMGFDSFGLPAENAARERNLDPTVWTNTNIRSMKQQLDDLAIQFDWREATSNPSFYKWTQSLFLKLMDAGLVYKSFAQVNWDPVDKTVLADEQVDEEGRSWRSGALIEKRFFRQWFVKVNAFAKDIWDADEVDPETWRDILAVQRGWIGTPCGWIFYLPIQLSGLKTDDVLPVFTRRPELFVSDETELVISSNHWMRGIHGIEDGCGFFNPFTGKMMKMCLTSDESQLPVGTKATIQTQRDNQSLDYSPHFLTREQVLLQAQLKRIGGFYTSERYRDWLISRQRFWGTPIPALHCTSCGFLGVDPETLPVTLPKLNATAGNLKTELAIDTDRLQVVSPIEVIAPEDWKKVKCPSCGGEAKRECETFDTLFDSSWYFLRYSSEACKDRPFDQQKVQPTWCYIGGKEHASMHLFYARFVTHFLHSIGELDFREPFRSLLVQGIVKSKTYKSPDGRYLSQEEVAQTKDKKKLIVEYEKMSKSKGNGVDPQELVDAYGVDATRFCLMSYANPRSERLWRSNEEEFREILTYLRRVFLTVQEYVNIGESLLSKTPEKGKKVNELQKVDLYHKKMIISDQRNKAAVDAIFHMQESFQFRQYISVLHVLTAVLRGNINNSSVYTREYAEALASLIVMLNPLMPHLSEELWFHFCRSPINPLRLENTAPSVSDQPWPLPDASYGRSRCFDHN